MDYEGTADAALARSLPGIWLDDLRELPNARDPSWNEELEAHWSTIRSVADKLMSVQRVTADVEQVQAMLTNGH